MNYTDQLGRSISVPNVPRRIISLVPSQTELLFHLGLGDRVVGVTKFCIHPLEALASKTKVGGTKKIDFDIIRQLNPDLIIGNKEENEQEQMERLMGEYPVWMSDIYNLAEALEMIGAIGEMTGTKEQTKDLVHKIYNAFLQLTFPNSYRATYLIWRNPFMAAGTETFLDDMMSRCGLINAFGKQSRYPQLTEDLLRTADPEVILLSSEPYPFKQQHVAEIQAICPGAKVLLVDGEMFSWYGSRLLFAPTYFQQLIDSLNR